MNRVAGSTAGAVIKAGNNQVWSWLRLGMVSGLLAAGSVSQSARGQGTLDYTVLQTGGGQALYTSQQVLPYPGVTGSALAFDFGFATDEEPQPGAFLDSFTVTLQDMFSGAAIAVTIDGNGVVWVPPSPGTVPLNNADIVRTPIVPPSLQPISSRGVGFSVLVPLPVQFTNSPLTVFFDLFDNQDNVMSLGWYHDARIVVVPEPSVAVLGAVALLIFTLRRYTA